MPYLLLLKQCLPSDTSCNRTSSELAKLLTIKKACQKQARRQVPSRAAHRSRHYHGRHHHKIEERGDRCKEYGPIRMEVQAPQRGARAAPVGPLLLPPITISRLTPFFISLASPSPRDSTTAEGKLTSRLYIGKAIGFTRRKGEKAFWKIGVLVKDPIPGRSTT
jgi:hypothetical protein